MCVLGETILLAFVERWLWDGGAAMPTLCGIVGCGSLVRSRHTNTWWERNLVSSTRDMFECSLRNSAVTNIWSTQLTECLGNHAKNRGREDRAEVFCCRFTARQNIPRKSQSIDTFGARKISTSSSSSTAPILLTEYNLHLRYSQSQATRMNHDL